MMDLGRDMNRMMVVAIIIGVVYLLCLPFGLYQMGQCAYWLYTHIKIATP